MKLFKGFSLKRVWNIVEEIMALTLLFAIIIGIFIWFGGMR